jgi:Uma2 family endonuclease
MAIAPQPALSPPLPPPQPITYEEYMTEEVIIKRYDIIDGMRIWMPNPNVHHQEVQGNLYERLRAWQRATRNGRTIMAPCDVLIRRAPMRTRQPDVLFITHERFGSRSFSDPSPLEPAPELVIEILSSSETRRIRDAKLADYCAVDVRECWVVDLGSQTIDVLRLTQGGAERAATYGMGETLQSPTFPDLQIEVAGVFAIEE